MAASRNPNKRLHRIMDEASRIVPLTGTINFEDLKDNRVFQRAIQRLPGIREKWPVIFAHR